MPDLKEIYDSRAGDYERLIIREDYQDNIPRAIVEIRDIRGLDVIELGAGTGRLTFMLALLARTIRAYDVSAHMLSVARAKLETGGFKNVSLEVAEHSRLPAAQASADVAIAGWSLVYSAIWAKGDWRTGLDRSLGEIKRVLRPGGTIILLETMGTGYTEPNPPDELRDYYGYLEQAGFHTKWIRTDYKFASVEEARLLVAFFFGEKMLSKIASEQPPILPECTGVWWKEI